MIRTNCLISSKYRIAPIRRPVFTDDQGKLSINDKNTGLSLSYTHYAYNKGTSQHQLCIAHTENNPLITELKDTFSSCVSRNNTELKIILGKTEIEKVCAYLVKRLYLEKDEYRALAQLSGLELLSGAPIEWRPRTHKTCPKPFRLAMGTLVTLAKARRLAVTTTPLPEQHTAQQAEIRIKTLPG